MALLDPAPRVLIAEDDVEIRKALERILRFEGYEPTAVADGAAALEELSARRHDLAVLDVGLPFVDGFTVCRRARDRGIQLPILILTARHGTPDKVEGLDAGADDYLTKPFEMDELLARARALLRRPATAAGDVLVVDDLRMDRSRRHVTRAGRPVGLTPTEFRLLEVLMLNAGRVLARGVLYEGVWGYDFAGSSRALDTHVAVLRRKLEADGQARLVHTSRSVGFVLTAPAVEG